MDQRQSNKATVHVLNVLKLFIDRTSTYGVTEVSQKLGISKNIAFRALKTLEEQSYVVRDRSGLRYELGLGVLGLNASTAEEFDIRTASAPYLRKLHDITGESVFLSVIVGPNHVTIDSVEAYGVRVSHNPRGLLVPLHASPASRVLLANLSDEEISDYIASASPLKRFTKTTITDPKKLWEEVQLVRRQGFARGYGDHYAHATYISFPVLDLAGRPHAAITIGGPPDRFTPAQIDALLPEILATMEELNRESRQYLTNVAVRFR